MAPVTPNPGTILLSSTITMNFLAHTCGEKTGERAGRWGGRRQRMPEGGRRFIRDIVSTGETKDLFYPPRPPPFLLSDLHCPPPLPRYQPLKPSFTFLF